MSYKDLADAFCLENGVAIDSKEGFLAGVVDAISPETPAEVVGAICTRLIAWNGVDDPGDVETNILAAIGYADAIESVAPSLTGHPETADNVRSCAETVKTLLAMAVIGYEVKHE